MKSLNLAAERGTGVAQRLNKVGKLQVQALPRVSHVARRGRDSDRYVDLSLFAIAAATAVACMILNSMAWMEHASTGKVGLKANTLVYLHS